MKTAKGFTLLELMIVVVIIAIIAGFAMFNYAKYGFRSRRVDGKEMLSRVAAAEERYYTTRNQYTTDLTQLNYAATAPCNQVGASEKCYYLVAAAVGKTTDNQSYLLTATPQNSQANDACKIFQLWSDGDKKFTGAQTNGNCW